MVRILTAAEVTDLIDLPAAVACTRQAFGHQSAGGVTAWAPSSFRVGGGMLFLRAGGLGAQGRMGARVTTGPSNPSYALVYDSPGGNLLSFMTYPFSEVRLHATVAVGVDALSRPDSRRVGLLGSGRNALGLLEGTCLVRPVESVAVYSPNAEHRSAFASRASEALGRSVAPVDRPETAVEGADIVLVATSSEAPALRGAWLLPNAHVTAIGSRTELDDDVFLRAQLIVTTSKVQEMNVNSMRDSWPIVRLTRDGSLDWNAVAELGDVLAGRASRPTSAITLFREAQGGFGDVALAALAYERAVELGLGIEWEP